MSENNSTAPSSTPSTTSQKVQEAQNQDTLGGRVMSSAMAGLNYAYMRSAGKGLRFFACMGLSYILMANVIAKYVLNDLFLIASWTSILTFYVLMIIFAAIIFIIFDVIKDLFVYLVR